MRKIRRDAKKEKMILDKYNEYSIKYDGKIYDTFPYNFFGYDENGIFNSECYDGREYVEYDENGKYSLLTRERGEVNYRKETYDIDELMYIIFSGYANGYGQGCELRNRPEGALEDPNYSSWETWVAIAIEKMGSISKEWQDRLAKEFDVIRKRNKEDELKGK